MNTTNKVNHPANTRDKTIVSASKPLYIVFFGPPMSGKGTLASRVANKLHLPHMDAGRIVRKKLKSSPTLLAHINAGRLLPDETVCDVLKDYLSAQTMLIDGFPRSLKQAQYLLSRDASLFLIELPLSLPVGLQRMRKRVLCGQCGATNNKTDKPCKCGASDWQQRPDDRSDILRSRYESYDEYSEKILNFYNKTHIPRIALDTTLPPEMLTQNLCSTILKHLEPKN